MTKLTLLFLTALPLTLAAASSTAGLRYIEGERPAGMSAAVVVDQQALAHTAQVFATGPNGEAPAGEAGAQIERTLENLSAALKAGSSGFERIVRIHVYVVEPAVTPLVEQALARRFPGVAKPAVTFVAGKLPVSGALVAMDAVAATPSPALAGGVVRGVARSLAAEARETHVAVLPAGPALFISGRVEPGGLEKGTRDTMVKLGTDLDLLGLIKKDVVQVKAFVAPIESADVVRREIRAFFGEEPVPPLVFVEWRSTGRVEIELVAAASVRSGEQPSAPVEYITPPGNPTNLVFTRLVRVNRGKLIYTAGLFGEPGVAAEQQVREVFSRLRTVVQQAGSDFENMAKATYYVTDNPSGTFLDTVRKELYNPQRTPASSKISVTGTGHAANSLTLDMIAVAP